MRVKASPADSASSRRISSTDRDSDSCRALSARRATSLSVRLLQPGQACGPRLRPNSSQTSSQVRWRGASARGLVETLLHERGEQRRNAFEWWWVVVEMLVAIVLEPRTRERSEAGQHLVGDHPQRVDIRSTTGSLVSPPFRRRIRRRQSELLGVWSGRRLGVPRNAKVSETPRTVQHEHICWLQLPMNHLAIQPSGRRHSWSKESVIRHCQSTMRDTLPSRFRARFWSSSTDRTTHT